MTARLSERDRRALMLLVPIAGLIILTRFAIFPFFEAAGDSTRAIESREKILHKYRAVVAATPLRESSAGSLTAVLAASEQGLLNGANPALQSAELQQLVKDIAAAQGIALRSVDFVAPKPPSGDYAQVSVSTSFVAGVDQVTALLNALQASPKILVVDHLRVTASNVAATPTTPAKKQVSVGILISGLARRSS